MSVSFFVPGIPVPQGRARSFRLGDGIGHYDDPKSKAWKAVVAQVAGLQRDRWHEGHIDMCLTFYLKAPKTMEVMEYCAKRPDIDNLAKAIMDALNGICYKDDGQICHLIVIKKYAHMTGVEVTIDSFGKGA